MEPMGSEAGELEGSPAGWRVHAGNEPRRDWSLLNCMEGWV